MSDLIALEQLTYSYPAWGDSPPPSLEAVDMILGAGLTIVEGDSGAGKSTLLRVLNGLVPHFHGGKIAGSASVLGMDVIATPTRQLARHVGFVFQEPEVGFVRATVEREIAFGPENLGLTPAAIRRQVGTALEQLGIDNLAGRRLRTLSGGERQRVAIAGVLAAEPTILAIDEPTSQLDAAGSAALAQVVAQLAASGRAVIAAEHRPGLFTGVDHIVNLNAGKICSAEPSSQNLLTSAFSRSRETRSDGVEAFSLSAVTLGVAGRALAEDVELAGISGDVLVLTGANGAGKTTLLRTIAGLIPALAGRVERRPGRVAYLPQEPGVLLHRTSVRAEVEQTLRWSQAPGNVVSVLDLLGLSSLADRDPRDLSGGQRQRAAIAAVLAGQPMLALLDEPTRGMDAAARISLAATINCLAQAGTTVMMATHDTQLASEIGGRRLHLENGKLHSLETEAS